MQISGANDPKPRREGAWVRTGLQNWFYTANPECYEVQRLWPIPPQMTCATLDVKGGEAKRG